MNNFYINSNNPTTHETLANIYDGADTNLYRNAIRERGLETIAAEEFQNGFENWECTYAAEQDAYNDRAHDECAYSVEVTPDDIAHALADLCGLVEIERSYDRSAVVIAETRELIASSLHSNLPSEWGHAEYQALDYAGYLRVSEYNSVTNRAYALPI